MTGDLELMGKKSQKWPAHVRSRIARNENPSVLNVIISIRIFHQNLRHLMTITTIVTLMDIYHERSNKYEW